MSALLLSSWFVLATTMIAVAALTTIMIASIDDRYITGSSYPHAEGQTISSNTNPVLVLDGTGKGTITCSNNDDSEEQETSDTSLISSPSSSSAAQITFKALGYPRGTHADIIGGGTASVYSADFSTNPRGANISMVGSSSAGSIYLEGFTLQIGNARVICPYSIEDSSSSSSSATAAIPLVSNQSLRHVGDVLISGKCGSSVQFSLEDVAEPFGFDGSFKGDVLCTISDAELTDTCTAKTGRDSDGDSIDDICDPTPFPDHDRDSIGDQRNEPDNCPSKYNPDQSDRERNGIGDACELYPLGLLDPDRDFVGDKPDEIDNCPYKYNPDQRDVDHDGVGDVCDPGQPTQGGQQPQQQSSIDRDSDGIPDNVDNCINKPNRGQRDSDRDRIGDVCDPTQS